MPRAPITTTVLSFLLASAAAHAQSLSFQARVDYDLAAEFPRQDVMADFDHDGHLDLAVTNTGNGGGRIDVHFGDGQGDFSRNYEIMLPNAECIGLGDFDADGWVDLAAGGIGWAQQAVHVWRNDHAGGFVAMATVYPLAWEPKGIATGDFNGDGFLDLAVASTSSSAVLSWFAGNGSFGFSTFHIVPSTYSNTGERLVAADFNGDGLMDLAMSHWSGARVFPNPGAGNFQNTFDLPTTDHVIGLQAIDMTRDGIVDLVTQSDSGHFAVWRNLGNATFVLNFESTAGGYTRDVSIGDVNRDGLLDAVMPTSAGFQALLGQLDGTFTPAQGFASGVQPMTGSLGDFDEDGWLDVAVSCNNGGGQAYLSVHLQSPQFVQSFCVPGQADVIACPCANNGAAGRGCANSVAASGALLATTGTTNPDTLVLQASSMPSIASVAAIFLQGDALDLSGIVFGDGVRCVDGNLIRLGSKPTPGGSAQYPEAGNASVSTRGLVTPGSGVRRAYQAYYRNAAAAFCPPGTFNVTNGVTVVW
ncbi:MAG: VCBS repeat-containing protein [Planctomycetes bacterium]|nr:VCBS repeat-containing protein [Planctomycetota bacterium]